MAGTRRRAGAARKAVRRGVIVTLESVEHHETLTYTIVPPDAADPSRDRISEQCPLARGIMGRRAGDTAEVILPGGRRHFRVLSVAEPL